jgi:two-component system response regulator HydG
MESELFGHVRGAFTDAKENRRGLFLEANGGTLFLDELGELPLQLQPKLLRVLQERKVRPLGGSQEVDVDVRVVCATNRDLAEAVRGGTFREDLYYRVNVLQIEVPSLRARGNDVLLLAQRFLEAAAARSGRGVDGLTPETAERLLAYEWPGNVRELQNCIERAVVLARYDKLTPDDLPEHLRVQKPRDASLLVGTDAATFVPLEEVERRYIMQVLTALGGNKSVAAQVLGLDRRTLYRKLVHWGVDAPSAGR